MNPIKAVELNAGAKKTMTTEFSAKKPAFGLVVFLTLIFPGLGFYYAGTTIKKSLAVIVLVSLTHTALMSVPDRLFDWKLSLLVSITSAMALGVVLIVTAVLTAKRFDTEKAVHKTYGKFFKLAIALLIVLAIADELADIRSRKNFSVPTASMEPTIKVGDRVRTNLIAYTKNQAPRIGDVVVFKYPKDHSISYIKRVAGVAGDKLRFSNDNLILNGSQQPRERAPESDSGLTDVGEDRSIKIFFKETLGGISHFVMQNIAGARPFSSPNWPENGLEFEVPVGTFFAIGDNRDNSTDSRVYGAIPLDLLVGKVEGVVFSIGGPQGVRWDRIGLEIR